MSRPFACCANGVAGPYTLLREAWERYRLPLAVTEAHLGCTREQQLRWLDEVWRSALQLRSEGVDVRAVTAWSAFGAHDWSSLLTRDDGCYEPGLFDISAPNPGRLHSLGWFASLAPTRLVRHPVLHGPGWWRCDQRLTYPAVSVSEPVPVHSRPRIAKLSRRPLLIVGATGTLGRACNARAKRAGSSHRALTRHDAGYRGPGRPSRAVLESYRPWAVVNCAGFVRVDDAERERHACRRANVDGAVTLAAFALP